MKIYWFGLLTCISACTSSITISNERTVDSVNTAPKNTQLLDRFKNYGIGNLQHLQFLNPNQCVSSRLEINNKVKFAVFHLYNLTTNGSNIAENWHYTDTEYCKDFDLLAAFNPDSIYISDMNKDDESDFLLCYTKDCKSDVSPAFRVLVGVNHAGKVLLKLTGYGLDPAMPNFSMKNFKFKYDPNTDDYNPNSPQGKIINYEDMQQFPASTQQQIKDIWSKSLYGDLAEFQKYKTNK